MAMTVTSRYAPAGSLVRASPRLWAGLGALSVLGLLAYPLPIAWAGLAGLGVLAALRWRLKGRPFPSSPLSVPLGLYLAGATVGLYVDIGTRAAGVRYFGLLAALGAFFLVLDGATTARAARRIGGGALLALLVAAPLLFVLVAPGQAGGYLPGPLLDLITSGTGDLGSLGRALRELDGPIISHRYRLTAGGLGMLAACGLGLALGPLLAGADRRSGLLGWLAMGYFGLFVALAANRGALLSALLIAGLLGGVRHRWLLAATLALMAVGAGAIVGMPGHGAVDEARQPLALLPTWVTDRASLLQRLEIWQNALFLLGDFRFTGVGLGLSSAGPVYQAYFLPHRLPVHHAHNIFLQSYLEQGLLGLVGLFALVTVGLAVGWRTLARLRDPTARSIAVSANGAALALVLTGLTEIGALTTVGMVLLFGALALLVTTGRLEGQPSRECPDHRPSPVARAAGVAAGATVVFSVVLLLLATSRLTSVGSVPSPTPALISRVLSAMPAALDLNLGALEVVRVSRTQLPPGEREQRLEAARYYLDRARDRDPENPNIYRNLAAVALAASDVSLARRMLSEAEALAAPDDSHQFFQLGRLYRDAGDVEGAIAAWDRVDRKFGARSGAGPDVQLVLWGTRLMQEERWQGAVAVNQAAIRAAPIQQQPYRALRVVITRLQGPEAALLTMRELASVYAEVPWPYLEVVELYKVIGTPGDVAAWEQRAQTVQASKEWEALLRRAFAGGGYLIQIK